MTNQELSQKQVQDVEDSESSVYKSTKETITSAAANLSGALNFSGGLSANAGAYKKTTTSSSGGNRQLSKEEADQLYEERIEDEYAKREGGA